MQPVLRLAIEADADFASRLVVAGWRDSYASFLPADLLAGLDQSPHHNAPSWRERIAAPSARTWIILEAGAEIGVARLDLDTSVPDARCELTTLYVDAGRRGRGIGAAALAHVLQEVERLEVWPLGLCVLSGNARGRRFYEQHGARWLGERRAFDWDGHDVLEAMYVMERGSIRIPKSKPATSRGSDMAGSGEGERRVRAIDPDCAPDRTLRDQPPQPSSSFWRSVTAWRHWSGGTDSHQAV